LSEPFFLVNVASASLAILRSNTDRFLLPFYALVAQTYPLAYEIINETLFDRGAVERAGFAKVKSNNDVFKYRTWVILGQRF